MGYPPAEGELDQASVPEAESDPAVDEPDHVAAQLDALAGMMARQDQALTPATADAVAEPSAEEPDAEEPQDTLVVETAEPTVDEPQELESDAETAAAEESSKPEQEIDPLTAPLAALTGGGATRAPAAAEPTLDPIDSADSVESADASELVTAPEAVLEPVESHAPEEPQAPEAAEAMAPRVPGTAATILRPAQLLIVATAALNLILVGLNAVLGSTSGSMTTVVLGVALITLAVWTGAAVTFLHWISRAHAHVAATAASRQRHGSSMSLLGWFIPIAGFVIGYRVLQDLWTGSDPATRDQADASPAKVRSIDIWLLGIVTAALFGYAMPAALGESALWGGLSALGLMVAALSLVSTMGAITAWQGDDVESGEEKAEASVPMDSAMNADGEVAAPAGTPETDDSASEAAIPVPVTASAE